MEERILICAPPRDARLTAGFLEESGFACRACRTWEELTTEWQAGAGAIVVAGELVNSSALASLERMLKAQPPWSDVAIILVAGDGSADQFDAFVDVGNISLLQRPVSLNILRSTVRAALRARRRQYQVHDLLHEKDESDRRKDEFLAMLAHELRNPLAPLRTGLELLRLGPSLQVVARTHTMMDRQITNMTRLIDDLLDVSRITRRKIALRLRPLDVRDSVAQAVDAVRHAAREKGLHLDVAVPTTAVMVNADAVRLEQMIGNLLSNAIKFTPVNGSIRVRAEVSAGFGIVRVTDTGVGLAPEHLDQVFDLFAQAPRTLDRTDGGLGIGLTVVKLLAELHGGAAEIFSRGEGMGTEAAIRLPAILDHGESPSSDEPAAGGRKVLIVEDNRDAAEMLAVYLEHVGHAVTVVHDGHAGLEAARRQHPEVLICDIGLPGIDGYEVARRLRPDPAFVDCLMIAVTGYGDVADREKARLAGFTHQLTKPSDPTQVAALIATMPTETSN
jgi:signal transduction histidine kinase/ActR/RegA family two-component response regulator